jgi:uncharacterized OB-fold protein
MTHSSHEAAGRVLSSAKHWLHCRKQEATHCRECDSPVIPWASHCPNCGQANPAKVSATAAIYLALAFALLTLTLSALIIAF